MNASHNGDAAGVARPSRPRPAGRFDRQRLDVIGVCVDDAGLLPGVAETVAELAALGHVSMTSCVVNSAHWDGASRVLARLQKSSPRFQCGLHFNLTEGAPQSSELARVWPRLPRLERLLIDAHLRRLPLAAIAAEWRAQCDAFQAALGCAPAFIDGHQHVHALPGVRELILTDLRRWPRLPAVRNTGRLIGPGHAFKRLVIESLGGRALQRTLAQGALPHNAAMVGVYGFETVDYGALVRDWLAAAPREGTLLMCHPLFAAPVATGDVIDPIAAARHVEANYLVSAAFAADLAAAHFTVGVPWLPQTTSAG